MKHSTEELTRDIHNIPFALQFKKSKEISPIGYYFVGNHNMLTDNQFMPNLKYYREHDYIILDKAFDMYGDPVKDSVGLYKKIE